MRLRQRIEKLEARVIDSDDTVSRDAENFMVKMAVLAQRIREEGRNNDDTDFPPSESISEASESSSQAATWSMILGAIGRELP